METKKLLYVGVRNRNTAVCVQGLTPGKNHHNANATKYRDGRSSSMEADIIESVDSICRDKNKKNIKNVARCGDSRSAKSIETR